MQMKPNVGIYNLPPGMQQKPFTPNSSRLNIFQPNMGSPATGSPRGRPPGGIFSILFSGIYFKFSGARMSSPSPRSFPKILQRNSSQQSPRFPLLMTGQHPQMSSPSQQSAGGSPMVQMGGPGGFMSPTHQQQQMMINLPPNMKQGPMQMMPGTSSAAADIPRVEQMSSSSSSTSSDDEI
jgi:hypothetical protein